MSRKILIVDDIESNRYLLRSLLEAHGYCVMEAGDGTAALAQARADLPDAVVTDLMMPVMDGFALCRAWMQDDQLWRIPFIVYTATYTQPKDRQFVLDLGADAYIIKPSEPDELLRDIEAVLDRVKPRTIDRHIMYDGDFFKRHADRLQAKLESKIRQLAHTKQQLTDYATRCAAILDASPVAIISIDIGLKIRTWNYAAERLFGYTEAEVLGHSFDMLTPEDRVAEARHIFDTVAASTGVARYDTRAQHKDGRLLEISFALSFIGASTGYVGVISDLTSLREATREKNRLEEQLMLAQRMESIGRLAGGVAHDFNNMLTVILSHADFIDRGLKDGDPLREDAIRIREAGERSASLTRQLLAFSRRRPVRPDVLEINHIVSAMENMLRRLIGEDIELSVSLARDLGRIEADAGRIEQVIMNLVVNARDAMPDGGRLAIETSNLVVDREEAEAQPVRPGRYVVITVSDTGCGMDDATQSRAFDPFFTTKGQGKGTGLGLAIVYGIIKQCQGYIRIQSEIDNGTTIKIFVPRADKPLRPRPTVDNPGRTRGGGETILIVEDEEMVREIARRILEQEGYRVLEAQSARDALTAASEGEVRIDLLLTDVVMPDMNGKELARRIVALRPDTKVAFTSGYSDSAFSDRCVLSAEISLIEKPFSATSLKSVVRDVLDGVSAGGFNDVSEDPAL